MHNNYDKIAPYYDRLAGIIFGKAQLRAQEFILDFIAPGNTILIVGGGSGWILEAISARFSSGINITYVEKSSKMLALACQRDIKQNSVEFVHADILDYQVSVIKDVIITAFLFDNFTQEHTGQLFHQLHRSLKESGLWLNVDFQLSERSKFRHRLMLKLMYCFFWFASNLETSKLSDIDQYFREMYTLSGKKGFFDSFIVSAVYKKSSQSAG